jgi:hypothetical protein
MKIDLNKYVINKPFVIEWYKKNERSPRETVSIIGTSTMCPNIVLAFYLADEIGYIPELIDLIDILITFYKITQIDGIVEGSPYFAKYKKT